MTATSDSASGRWPARAGWTLAATGLVCAAAVAGSAAWVRATARGQVFAEADVPPAPVALVLGAQVEPDGTPSPFLAGRLDVARRLYASGRVRAILVSGDNLAVEYNEPKAMRDYLIAAGVPAAKVVADYAGFDTYDSCARAGRIFGVSELVVVSQSYHLPRAVATCRALGLQACGVGDETARQYAPAWRRGVIRDQVACVKTIIDLLTRRDPVLGARELGVDRALRS